MPRNVVTLRLPDGTEVEAVKGSRLADIYVARGARELTEKGNPRRAPRTNPLVDPEPAPSGAAVGELEKAVEVVTGDGD